MHSRIELLIYLISLFQLFTEPCVKGYNIKCPGPFQRIFRSEGLCNSNGLLYTCLYNTFHLQYSERCIKKEYQSRKGKKRVLSPAINEIDCEDDKFQPIPFTTNSFTDCMFRKSKCKEEGQVIISNGSTFIDRTCKCDYDSGYVYVTQPKDKCSCVPSQEDCSCFLRHCKENKILSADYDCVPENSLRSTVCGDILDRIVPSEETVTVDTCDKIQLQQISGSGTWSKQPLVFLIVVVIIYIGLIGFLFYCVPHVKSIYLKSKLELTLKRKENEFMILKGDNVKIECSIKSYIRVRSVTWQKEIDNEIIQITSSKGKYEIDSGKRPSLTIDNFNAEDQGKYRCIVKNAFGLRNGIFNSCINFMSRFGWLTGFVTVLQHIPAFHTEDITLHIYDIDSQSKPTVYHVYKGDTVTIDQHANKEQKLIAVFWLKESDKWTKLNISNEQFSGGVSDVPSLTIKKAGMHNAGYYICLLIYDNGETQDLFQLTMPQVKIYAALSDHRKDKTFIRPSICDTIDKQLRENSIVVITGREGTGKSKICLELASIYDEKDYMVFEVDLSENQTIYTNMVDTLLIIDDQQYTQHSLNAFMEQLLPVLSKRNIKVILTCRNVDLEFVRRVPEIHQLKEEVFIDIDSCLTAEEKEEILRSYMKVKDVTSSSSAESNFRNLKIVTDLSVQVTLDENAIKLIRNEEPWKGFPLSALLFCSKRKLLHLGEKYFTNPPRYIFEELKELFRTTRKNSELLDIVNEYCILVYIIDNSNHQLDLNDPDLYRKLVELYLTVFQFKYIPEKPGSNEDQKIAIEKALHSMNNKYLKIHEGVYKFIHPCLSKAMFLSSDYMFEYLLQKGSLSDITEFVRSKDYTALENELVIKVTDEHKHNLCESLLRHAFENHNSLQNVAKYIYTHWRLSDSGFVDEIFSHIESILFLRLGVQNDNFQPLDNDSFSESSINLEDPVKFSNIIALVDELTYKGRDPWIYKDGKLHIFILSGLVTAAMHKYATSKVDTFEIILSEFQKRMQEESFVKLCKKPLDACGNTIFHFLMHFNEMEVCQFLTDFDKRKIILDTENVKKYTPLDIASYLGKVNILKVLNIKTNYTNKLRDRFRKLARNGKVMFYDETSKNKSYEQAVVDIIKDSEKLHKENADDGKEEDKNEIQKKETFFKRTWRFIKNQHKKTEKHDKIESELEFIDILCLDDYLINAVEFGKVEDYQLVINLLS